MITLNNISLKFGERIIFDNLNMIIQENDRIFLSGKSGIGKTTLMQMILGFNKKNSGKILFKNEEINKRNIWDIRKKISYVPQNIQFKDTITQDIIQDIFDLKCNKGITDWQQRLSELHMHFELDDKILQKNWSLLSGGEKQRISLIIASLLSRRIFFLDEVTSALDKNLKKIAVKHFLEKENSTIIVISHDMEWLKNDDFKIFNLERHEWQQ